MGKKTTITTTTAFKRRKGVSKTRKSDLTVSLSISITLRPWCAKASMRMKPYLANPGEWIDRTYTGLDSQDLDSSLASERHPISIRYLSFYLFLVEKCSWSAHPGPCEWWQPDSTRTMNSDATQIRPHGYTTNFSDEFSEAKIFYMFHPKQKMNI